MHGSTETPFTFTLVLPSDVALYCDFVIKILFSLNSDLIVRVLFLVSVTNDYNNSDKE